MTKITAAITGVEGYLPDYVLTNKELETLVDTNDQWILERTGIKERRILKGENLGSSHLGAQAVSRLLKKTDTSPEDIDLIICCTVTPDMFFPSTANIIAGKVGATKSYSFDINAACSGFLYGLTTAAQFISSGAHKKVVVVGAEKMSSIVDYTDRATCVIFGDGAAAVLLEPNYEGLGLLDFEHGVDAEGEKYLLMPAGGSRRPSSHQTIDAREHYIKQEGRTVFKFAVTHMAEACTAVMQRNDLGVKDLAFVVPHQANKRIIDAIAHRLDLNEEQVMINIERYGNTTSATIPLCLRDYEGKIKKGDNLLLTAFGGGFTWGAIYLKWAY